MLTDTVLQDLYTPYYASYIADLHGIDLSLQYEWCVRRILCIWFYLYSRLLDTVSVEKENIFNAVDS